MIRRMLNLVPPLTYFYIHTHKHILLIFSDQEIKQISPGPRTSQTEIAQNSAHELLKIGAACNVLYIGTVDTESLTGPQVHMCRTL